MRAGFATAAGRAGGACRPRPASALLFAPPLHAGGAARVRSRAARAASAFAFAAAAGPNNEPEADDDEDAARLAADFRRLQQQSAPDGACFWRALHEAQRSSAARTPCDSRAAVLLARRRRRRRGAPAGGWVTVGRAKRCVECRAACVAHRRPLSLALPAATAAAPGFGLPGTAPSRGLDRLLQAARERKKQQAGTGACAAAQRSWAQLTPAQSSQWRPSPPPPPPRRPTACRGARDSQPQAQRFQTRPSGSTGYFS